MTAMLLHLVKAPSYFCNLGLAKLNFRLLFQSGRVDAKEEGGGLELTWHVLG